MKTRMVAAACCFTLASGLVGTPGSTAAGAGRKGKVVTGTVAIPNGRGYAAFEIARCAWLAGGDRSQGLLGHMVTLKRGGAYDYRRFSLVALRDPVVTNDALRMHKPIFDVAFYREQPSCGSAGAALATYEVHRGNSSGFIPYGARFALIIRPGANVIGRTCYSIPPICSGPSHPPWATAYASGHADPEPFAFRIHPRHW